MKEFAIFLSGIFFVAVFLTPFTFFHSINGRKKQLFYIRPLLYCIIKRKKIWAYYEIRFSKAGKVTGFTRF
jgi:hypothetical protein